MHARKARKPQQKSPLNSSESSVVFVSCHFAMSIVRTEKSLVCLACGLAAVELDTVLALDGPSTVPKHTPPASDPPLNFPSSSSTPLHLFVPLAFCRLFSLSATFVWLGDDCGLFFCPATVSIGPRTLINRSELSPFPRFGPEMLIPP